MTTCPETADGAWERGSRLAPRPVVVVVALSLLLLVGCSRESPERQAEALERADEALEIAETTYDAIAAEVPIRSYTGTGVGRWAQCGMDPSPSGAEYIAKVSSRTGAEPSGETSDAFTEALEDTGWTVTSSGSESPKAERGQLRFTSSVGPGGMNLEVSTGCIDLSVADVQALTDRPSDDLGLAPPEQD